MTPRDQDAGLDRLLQTWSAARSAEDVQLDRLHDRIVAELDRDPPAIAQRPRSSAAPRHGVAWFLAGAACSLLVTTAVLWFGRGESDSPLSSEARLFADHARRQAAVYARINELFDRRVAWLADTPRGVEFGVRDETDDPFHGEPLALRFVVERRQTGERTWQPVWSADVVTASEQPTEIANREATGPLRVWAYRLPDGMIYVESEFAVDAAGPLRTTRLLVDGQPQETRTAADGAEYRIVQAAARLSEPS
jgi:hypothetical protein